MKKIGIAVATVVASAFASVAGASVAWQGTTHDIHFMRTGIVLVYTTGARNAAEIPACGSSQPNRFSFDSTTPGGKALLAGILSADAAKRSVVIVGSGTCVYPDSEGIDYFYLAD